MRSNRVKPIGLTSQQLTTWADDTSSPSTKDLHGLPIWRSMGACYEGANDGIASNFLALEWRFFAKNLSVFFLQSERRKCVRRRKI